MLSKLSQLFKIKESPEAIFLKDHKIHLDPEQGYIVDGVVLNQALGERLEYLSNRRMKTFDDLKALYFAAMLINEKIDLEIATGRYAEHVANTQENLIEFKALVQLLNQYYREFLREKR